MKPLPNDRWRGEFSVGQMGRYRYTVEGWVDAFQSWRRDLIKRIQAGQDVSIDLLVGARLLQAAASRASGEDADRLRDCAAALAVNETNAALDENTAALALRYPDRTSATRYDRELIVTVDRPKARFSTWYEMFPRSRRHDGRARHLRDCEARLPYIAAMGFDVLYLPPIHPIGSAFRKGRTILSTREPRRCGQPLGDRRAEGGHKVSIPRSAPGGFRPPASRRRRARTRTRPGHRIPVFAGSSLCARASGMVPASAGRHDPVRGEPAQEIPGHLSAGLRDRDWQELWEELRSVFDFWIEQGVRIFRVDNPHTKPLPFWEW